MKIYLRLLRYLRPYIWPPFTIAMVCMAGYSATSGALPFLVQRVIDDVFAQKDKASLFYLPFVIVGIFAFRGFVNFGDNYLTAYVGLRIINDVRDGLNRHLQFLSLSFFQRHPTGTLISRVTNDVALVRSALTDSVASLIRDTTSLLALIVVAFLKDWVLATIGATVYAYPASFQAWTK